MCCVLLLLSILLSLSLSLSRSRSRSCSKAGPQGSGQTSFDGPGASVGREDARAAASQLSRGGVRICRHRLSGSFDQRAPSCCSCQQVKEACLHAREGNHSGIPWRGRCPLCQVPVKPVQHQGFPSQPRQLCKAPVANGKVCVSSPHGARCRSSWSSIGSASRRRLVRRRRSTEMLVMSTAMFTVIAIRGYE